MDNSEKEFSGNGNKFIRYYPAEGKNEAFKNLNGAFQRGVEEEASIQTTATMKSTYPEGSYNEWLENKESQPDIEKRARIQFVKDCERLALLPEKDLIELCKQSSERLSSGITHKGHDREIEREISGRAYLMKYSYNR